MNASIKSMALVLLAACFTSNAFSDPSAKAEPTTPIERYGKEFGLNDAELLSLRLCNPVAKATCKSQNTAHKKACDQLSGDEQAACTAARQYAYNKCIKAAGC